MPGPTHFLIIAVEHYSNKPFSRVKWAEDDAKDLIKAWQSLGYHPNDFIVLINKEATKTAIEYHVKKIMGRAQGNDRIVFFFAGHGLSVHGDSFIVPIDGRDDAPDTCVSIHTVLGYLKNSDCKRNLLFLDCCHSGFEPGENVRDAVGDFLIDDLAYALKDEVYCVGFASCKSHQKSNSHEKLQHGIWSHFLIEALSGNANDIYDQNHLLSDDLQSYLRTQTADFAKKYTDDRRDQTPMVFGSFTDRFIIEDLSPIFEARETERRAAAFNMTSIVIFDTDDGRVRDLPEFRKGNKVPDRHGSAQENFIRNASGDMVSDEIDDMSVRIKNALGYGIDDFKTEKGRGYATVQTPDFSYTVEIGQSPEDHTKYLIKRTLDAVYNDDIINDPRFNEVFDNHFRQLSFQFDKKINVRDFIARVEKKVKALGITLQYAPTNPNRVRIIFPDSHNEIVVDGATINITIPHAESPARLVEAYKQTSRQLDGAKMNLLEFTK